MLRWLPAAAEADHGPSVEASTGDRNPMAVDSLCGAPCTPSGSMPWFFSDYYGNEESIATLLEAPENAGLSTDEQMLTVDPQDMVPDANIDVAQLICGEVLVSENFSENSMSQESNGSDTYDRFETDAMMFAAAAVNNMELTQAERDRYWNNLFHDKKPRQPDQKKEPPAKRHKK